MAPIRPRQVTPMNTILISNVKMSEFSDTLYITVTILVVRYNIFIHGT